jgi:P27 family predicted phage terminase small subunit
MAGRPPKPTALKLVEGNRGKRAAPSHEPEPALLNDLTPPAHLPAEAAAVWNELAPKLRRAQLLTELDTLALEWLCVAAAQHRHATAAAGDDKLIMRNAETGSLSPSPWLMIQSMSFKRGKLLCDAFGMNPVARSRVMVNPQDDLFSAAAQAGPGRFFK